MSLIDITMTATIRPWIVKQTLESFCKSAFLKKKSYRLIVNIDPIGENLSAKSVVNVCKSFFDNMVYSIPREPSFSKAVQAVWRMANAKYIFHLEDDWVIYRKIDIGHMIKLLDKYDDLACLRLCRHRINKEDPVRLWGCRYDYNKDGFFVARDSGTQFGLNPVLIKGDFVKEAVRLMVDDRNPEKQFRYSNEVMRDFVMRWKYGVYARYGDKPLVFGEYGEQWRKIYGFAKPDFNKFTTWERR